MEHMLSYFVAVEVWTCELSPVQRSACQERASSIDVCHHTNLRRYLYAWSNTLRGCVPVCFIMSGWQDLVWSVDAPI